jgi:hypothetical protein
MIDPEYRIWDGSLAGMQELCRFVNDDDPMDDDPNLTYITIDGDLAVHDPVMWDWNDALVSLVPGSMVIKHRPGRFSVVQPPAFYRKDEK